MIGKNILIIGASSGIGKATAEILTQQGANVILVARNEEKLKEILKDLKGKNFYLKYDLHDLNNIGEIFTFCNDKKIKLDGMVHCAGIAPLALIKDNNIPLMMETFSINYFSFIELVKYFQLPHISNENSSIIAISSVASQLSGYRQVLYGSSKAAINSSVKLMAKELLNRKIRINSIILGAVNTEMLDDLRKNSINLDQKIVENQPLGIIEADSVADFICYLLSSKSCYLTGLNIPFEGGRLL